MKEQLKEMIPISDLFNDFPKFFNLISWSIFIGILIFAGGKISSLGIKLVKK